MDTIWSGCDSESETNYRLALYEHVDAEFNLGLDILT